MQDDKLAFIYTTIFLRWTFTQFKHVNFKLWKFNVSALYEYVYASAS